MSGDTEAAGTEVGRLQKLREVTASRKLGYWVMEIDVQAAIVQGMAQCASGRRSECLETLRAAATREDTNEKHVVTPGRLLPAREVLAIATLQGGDAASALQEFERVLEREPNRLGTYAGAAEAADGMGAAAKAQEYMVKVGELTQGADAPILDIAQVKRLLGR
jgi:hypothetical protein